MKSCPINLVIEQIIIEKYDEFIKQADILLKQYNPCAINSCGICTAKNTISNGLCCTGCKHLGIKGCTTKSLSCKLWLCYETRNNPIKREFDELYKQINPWIPWMYRASREKHIEYATKNFHSNIFSSYPFYPTF